MRAFTIVFLVILALPVPLSLGSWIGTLMSVAALKAADWSKFSGWIQALTAFATMIVAGTYMVSYGISLVFTIKNKALSLVSFMPVGHIVLFVALCIAWFSLNKFYGT